MTLTGPKNYPRYRPAATWKIDGSTLEKRREQRKEQLEQHLWEIGPDRKAGIQGMVSQWTKEGGTKVVPSSQSLFDLEAKEKKLKEYEEKYTFADLEPVVKRTPQQRLDSLVKRLQGSDPVYNEAILKDVAAEYWKAGAPVSVDALRAVAAHFLNRTTRK